MSIDIHAEMRKFLNRITSFHPIQMRFSIVATQFCAVSKNVANVIHSANAESTHYMDGLWLFPNKC